MEEPEQLEKPQIQMDWNNPKVVSNHRRRTLRNNIMVGLILIPLFLALYPLADMFLMFVYKGLQLISVSALVSNVVASGGATSVGIGNAITGTLLILGYASLFAVPIGVFGGVYLGVFSHGGRLGNFIGFVADLLAGMPSIVLGFFGFLTLVVYFGWGYSALAAGVTLSVLMLPFVLRATELSIRKVPSSYIEAAEALGSTRTQIINKLSLRVALPGIITGILIATGYAIGETAPLLYTASFSNYPPCPLCLHTPVAYLTGVIFSFYALPFANDKNLAYLAAFMLIVIVICINIGAKFTLRRLARS